MHILIISGLSGSGKSIALNLLEDAAYYCVDNLPPQLLQPLVDQLGQQGYRKIAVAIDIRGGGGIETLPQQLDTLRAQKHDVQFLFLDSKTETLRKRYSETRRRHPLASDERTLSEAIAEERVRLARVAELGHHIDTSDLKPNALREWIRQFITANGGDHEPQTLTLSFESFGFKHGLPSDSDYVFDVRMLPNPHYDADLRPLTGMDKPVADFLRSQPEAMKMLADIERFLDEWLPVLAQNHRSYVTVAIGCTGGQHRSVFLVEALAARFAANWPTLRRHRALESQMGAMAGKAARR